MPAYVIFHDSTLQAIAHEKPTSMAGLSRIAGLGERKLATYGEQILAVIRGGEYRAANGRVAHGVGARDQAGASTPLTPLPILLGRRILPAPPNWHEIWFSRTFDDQ